MQRLHDELDTAVADAYGWEVDLKEEEALRRLLELNWQRGAEEKIGMIPGCVQICRKRSRTSVVDKGKEEMQGHIKNEQDNDKS